MSYSLKIALKNLIIYGNNTLFKILNEIKDVLKFELINVPEDNLMDLKPEKFDNYLIISKKKIENLNNQIIIREFPIKIDKLLQLININFLKFRFNLQSKINIGSYILDLNSRIIETNKNKINLTEREIDIIVFLKNSEKPISVSKLQKDVWGHTLKLETHTVETHIYRLRNKIKDKFDDENFIVSAKNGYLIN